MAHLILLFNHTVTAIQADQARQELGVEKILEPPDDIRRIWSALPPEEEQLAPVLEPVVTWLDSCAEPGDQILIQGDFGACFLLATHALRRGYTPLYSTTHRQAVEEQLKDGSVRLTHTFRHVRFREYGR